MNTSISIVEAVYQQGLLKPLKPLDLPENKLLWLIVQPMLSDGDIAKAVDDPCGAFPELDLSYEEIELITRSAWESKAAKLINTLTGDAAP